MVLDSTIGTSPDIAPLAYSDLSLVANKVNNLSAKVFTYYPGPNWSIKSFLYVKLA